MRQWYFGLGLLAALLVLSPSGTTAQSRVQIIKHSTSEKWAWLGVGLKDAEGKDEGAAVTEVTEDSPADSAGIKEDDIIVKFDGREVKDAEDLVKAVQKQKPGTNVTIEVLRDGAKKTLHATLRKQKQMKMENMESMHVTPPMGPQFFLNGRQGVLGLKVMELRGQLGRYFEAPDGKGLLVEEVKKNSAAEKAGIHAGDVIVRAGDESVQVLRDLTDAIEDCSSGDSLALTVIRKGVKKSLSAVVEKPEHSEFLREFNFNFPNQEQMFELQHKLDNIQPQIKRLQIRLNGNTVEI
jgi:serine protease Do